MAGYVYLIGSPEFCWYKIGKSRDAKVRVKDLGILLPFKIEVIAIWRADNHHGLEELLHEKYASSRINGEWFSFSKPEVQKFLATMPESMDCLAEFTNIQKNHGPGGTVLKVVRKLDLPQEERQRRKEAAIALRRLRKTS